MAMDLETWMAAMDANPACAVTMAAFSDWLQEQGDPKWVPIQFLARHGKVGKPPWETHPGSHYSSWHWAYAGTAGSGEYSPKYPPEAVVDPEWANRALLRWSPPEECRTLAAHRLLLAVAWEAADGPTRRRWQWNTARTGADWADVDPPDVQASRRWLEEFAASVPRESSDYYADDDRPVTLGEPVQYALLLARAAEFQSGGDWAGWSEGPRFDGFGNGDDFWSHYAVVTGGEVKKAGSFFGCSC